MTRLLAVIAFLLPAAVAAQTMIEEDRLPSPWIEIVADVTGDGQAERLRAMPFDLDWDLIAIEPAVDAHFSRPLSTVISANRTGEAGIEVTSDTSFLLRTGCFACGRTHSEFLYKIAYRGGLHVVAGYTETMTDRIFALTLVCDVNHLTGRAEIIFDGEIVAELPASRSIPLAAWDEGRPRACEATRAYESDSFMESYIANRDD